MNLVDMHCDTISRIRSSQLKNEEVSLLENSFHIDLGKLKKGNYLLQNFALFVELKGRQLGYSEYFNPLEEALALTDIYYDQLNRYSEYIAPVFTYSDILENQKNGKISSLLTLEEGGICKGSLANLRMFHKLGVRMLTLTWNYKNELGYPNIDAEGITYDSPDDLPDFTKPNTTNGLTDIGLSFLLEMERIGVIPDVSHLSDAGFYDVYTHSKKPFVASHSNARAVCPWVRNMTDDMIRKLSEKGGVMGLNFCPDFLESFSPNKKAEGTVASIVEHAKHIYQVGGIECLSLGTDYDGIDGHKELPDASYMPNLFDAFQKAGFTNSELDKIASQNVLRVYREWFS